MPVIGAELVVEVAGGVVLDLGQPAKPLPASGTLVRLTDTFDLVLQAMPFVLLIAKLLRRISG